MLADAHYNPLGRTEVLEFFRAVISGAFKTDQLFLMGDIADLLIGTFAYCRDQNRELITLIDQIAQMNIEIWYFEGNHDFALNGVFDPRVHIVPKRDQPAAFTVNGKRAFLLHGDFRVELRYAIYAEIIRNKFGLMITHILSFNFINYWLFRAMQKRLMGKKLSYMIADFAKKRALKIADLCENADLVIEGHFHQNCGFAVANSSYYNLPSFACGKSFIQLESAQIKEAFI